MGAKAAVRHAHRPLMLPADAVASPCSDASRHAPLLCRIRDHGQCAGLHPLLPGTEPGWVPCLALVVRVLLASSSVGFQRGKRLQVCRFGILLAATFAAMATARNDLAYLLRQRGQAAG